jgi:hypothetical protein
MIRRRIIRETGSSGSDHLRRDLLPAGERPYPHD